MGRIHSNGKGISGRSLPWKRTAPSWARSPGFADDTVQQICTLSKKGLTPSQIGVILRDSHGVGQTRAVTGNKVVRILKANGLAPTIPEDLYHLLKKAVSVHKHLDANRKDLDAKYRLRLIEARIHRLSRHFKISKALPPTWKYDSKSASALVA